MSKPIDEIVIDTTSRKKKNPVAKMMDDQVTEAQAELDGLKVKRLIKEERMKLSQLKS